MIQIFYFWTRSKTFFIIQTFTYFTPSQKQDPSCIFERYFITKQKHRDINLRWIYGRRRAV